MGERGGRDYERCRPLCLRPAPEAGRAEADRDRARGWLRGRAMMPRSLRARSILAALIAIVIAIVIVGAGIDVLVGRRLHRSLDGSLRHRAVEVAQLSATAPALITSPGSLDAPVGGTQLLTEVLDQPGRIIARSLALGGGVLRVGDSARG